MTKAVDFHGDFGALDEDARDDIINPKHYELIPPGTYPDGLEYMDVMTFVLEDWSGVHSHLLGQAFKYMFRCGHKDHPVQDLDKAIWYLTRLKEETEKNTNNTPYAG